MIKKALLNRLSKKVEKSGEPTSYSSALSFGIVGLYELSDQIESLAKAFQGEGKSCRTIYFVTKPNKKENYPTNTFTPKDITLSGAIQSVELQYFTKQAYDFLICLDPSGSKFMKYLLSKTVSGHKVGLFHANFKAHLDMMLMPKEIENASAELIKYVKMIRHD